MSSDVADAGDQSRGYIHPDLKTCLEAVMRIYGQNNEEALKWSRRGERNEARAMAIYVCRSLAGLKQEVIAQAFGVSGYSAVSSVIGRVRVEMKKGGEIARRYHQIQELLQR
jgi:chromosomal replication initiation ATPase DnaA